VGCIPRRRRFWSERPGFTRECQFSVGTALPLHPWPGRIVSSVRFLRSLIEFFVGSSLIDYIAVLSTKRNHGVWEPEIRLVALIIPSICGPAAMLIVGFCFRYQTPWIAPAIGTALLGLTITPVNNICVTYAVDSYLTLPGEVITIVFSSSETPSRVFWLSIAIPGSKMSGVAQALGTMGAILLGFGVSSIVISWFGKRLRQLTTRYGVLKATIQS
jgi:hypothetical protein